ncbi:MAG: Phage terminase small subunit family [Akkermansiaceae bacterium]|nr:Phage terminase small subunit family [Akkermansiaceae bacterium]
MGVRGTKPKENVASTKAALLSPLAVRPPPLVGGAPAEKEYIRLATELRKLGHLTAVNRQCLVNYCEAWSIAQDALEQLRDDGITLESGESGNKYMHPALNAWSMARKTMETEAKNLGMTPASLQSIKAVKPAKSDVPKDGPSSFLT